MEDCATPLNDDDDEHDDDDDDDGLCDDDGFCDDDGGTPALRPPVRDAREQTTTRDEPKNDAGDGDRG